MAGRELSRLAKRHRARVKKITKIEDTGRRDLKRTAKKLGTGPNSPRVQKTRMRRIP